MTVLARVLLVGGDDASPHALAAGLVDRGFEPVREPDVRHACARLRRDHFVAVLADLDAPGTEALALLRAARRHGVQTPTLLRLRSEEGSPAALATVRDTPEAYVLPAVADEALLERLVRVVNRDRSLSEGLRRAAEVLYAPAIEALAPLRAAVTASSPSELDDVRWQVADTARAAAGAEATWLLTWDQWGESIERSGRSLPTPRTLAREVRLARRSIVQAASDSGATHVGVPVTFEGEVVAALLARFASHLDVTDVLPLLEGLARHAEVAEAGARLRRRLDESRDSLVAGLWNVLALRGIEVSDHAARVADAATRLAIECGFRPATQALLDVRRAALLHDVGKIGVPEAVARKTGPLDDAERAAMRRHPEYAERILRGLPDMAEAGRLILATRERWDGTGYPLRLAGTDIPTGARVVAVADAWDDVLTAQPSRSRDARASATEEITREASTRFDPDIVRALVHITETEARRLDVASRGAA